MKKSTVFILKYPLLNAALFSLIFNVQVLAASNCNCPIEKGTVHLWKNHVVSVDIVDRHLQISPIRSVKDPKELSPDEVVNTWQTSKKLASIFEKVFGTRDFFEYCPVQKDGSRLYTEIIPVDGTSKYVDVAAKVHRSIYAISGREIDNCQLTDDQIKKIQSVAKKILNENSPVFKSEKPVPKKWQVHWKNRHQALHIVQKTLNNFQSTPHKKLIEYQTEQLDGEFCLKEKGDRTTWEVHSCAFCDKKVTADQSVIEKNTFYLLVNHKPYIPDKHLMAVPKKHKQNRECFTEKEALEEHKLFVITAKAFEKMFGKNIPYCRFTQNGFYAGQTVPHSHTHFLAGTGQKGLIIWLKHVLEDLEGNNTPPMSKQEIAESIKSYRQNIEI